MKKIAILFILFFVIGCMSIDDKLTIINKTNKALIICPIIALDDTLTYSNNKEYVDNALPFETNLYLPKEKKKLQIRGKWETLINDTLVFLVFDKDKVVKSKREKPNENYAVQKIIYVSENYLFKHDWTMVIDSSKTPIIVKL